MIHPRAVIGTKEHCTSLKSRCTLKSCCPRNVAAYFSQLIPKNATLEISLHGKESTTTICMRTRIIRATTQGPVQDVYGEGVLSVISVIPNEVSSRSQPCIWLEVTMGIFFLNWNPIGDSDTFLPMERQSEGSILNALAGVRLCSSP